jgi:Phage integrase family
VRVQAPGKLTLQSLRHGFASLLIANGLNVVYVSRQLGHANPSFTLEVYAHLFDRADDAATARDALDSSYAAMIARARSLEGDRAGLERCIGPGNTARIELRREPRVSYRV